MPPPRSPRWRALTACLCELEARIGDVMQASRPILLPAALVPYQFSMWHRLPYKSGVDRNYDEVVAMAHRLARGNQGSAVIEDCVWVASGILDEALRDRVKGCTHYHAASMQPAWARGSVPRMQVGSHVFYTGIR